MSLEALLDGADPLVHTQHPGVASDEEHMGEFSRLFQKTFATAKRVRTETNIGESAVSVAYAACSLARQIFESLRELTILLMGAGETIELVNRHLLRHGVKNIVIANRTLARAETLLDKLERPQNVQAIGLEHYEIGRASCRERV